MIILEVSLRFGSPRDRTGKQNFRRITEPVLLTIAFLFFIFSHVQSSKLANFCKAPIDTDGVITHVRS